jgi:hypothetical protein
MKGSQIAHYARLLNSLLVCSISTALLLAQTADNGAAPPKKEAAREGAQKDTELGTVEVRFTDGRKRKATLADERVELTTPYGKLVIPVASIHRISFASRTPADVIKRVDAAILELGNQEFQRREDASKELRELREKAYPSLLVAAKDKDSERARRAEEVLQWLRDALPEEDLVFRKNDVIHTEDSKIAGRLVAEELKVRGGSSGVEQLKLRDVRSLRSLAVDDEEDMVAAADPGNLKALEGSVGKTFRFKVTGVATGSVWGTDVYTTDSTLATAAVHAGVLKAGQTAVVRVKIVAPPATFEGSTRNGVTTGPWGAYPGAYQVSK